MKRTLALLTLAAVPVFGLAPGTAGSEDVTVTYVPRPGGAAGATIPVAEMRVGAGGYVFTPSLKPLRVRIVDNNGPGIPWVACQEGPSQEGELPNTCGDGDDGIASNCSNNNWQSLGSNFRPDISFVLFVRVASTPAQPTPECPGVSLGGTLSIDLYPQG